MIAVLGAGAFGAALAIVLAQDGHDVVLWARDPDAVAAMRSSRIAPRLPGAVLPDAVIVTADLHDTVAAEALLLAVPAQALGGLLATLPPTQAAPVACCKGIDLVTGNGPSGTIAAHLSVPPLVLTGPSFAADIARGLPTALTLACADADLRQRMQALLSTRTLRLYTTPDVRGAELGGALKNVIAIACGVCIGAGLGDSARAALMTRGFAEMTRFATLRGAQPETLTGLSGLGDLALTCTSDLSRNYRHGLALGRGAAQDAAATVEGVATAQAMARIAQAEGLDMPLCRAVAALVTGKTTVEDALTALLSRPLKEEHA
ncbi:MAG: NAD(P)-dependent glycerol-3-phosphate dehydrogenase [Roseivivax sp.]|nr:NAD(P)-dependent glycerol-3-phosphate dehydrogenase [Roseivivax sp.]